MHVNIAKVLVLVPLMTSLLGCGLLLGEPQDIRGVKELGCTNIAVASINSIIDKPVTAKQTGYETSLPNSTEAQTQGVSLKFLDCTVIERVENTLGFQSHLSFGVSIDFEIKNDSGGAISLARDTMYLTGLSSSQDPNINSRRCDTWKVIPYPDGRGNGSDPTGPSIMEIPPGVVRHISMEFEPINLRNGEIGCVVPVSLGDEGKVTFELRLADEAKAK